MFGPGLDQQLHKVLVEVIVQDAFQPLAELRAHVVLREDFAGAFVAAHLQHVGFDADLIQQVFVETDLRAHPGQQQPARFRQADFVAANSQQVILAAAGFQISVSFLAHVPKTGDRLAQLVQLPPADLESVDMEEQPVDRSVALGFENPINLALEILGGTSKDRILGRRRFTQVPVKTDVRQGNRGRLGGASAIHGDQQRQNKSAGKSKAHGISPQPGHGFRGQTECMVWSLEECISGVKFPETLGERGQS